MSALKDSSILQDQNPYRIKMLRSPLSRFTVLSIILYEFFNKPHPSLHLYSAFVINQSYHNTVITMKSVMIPVFCPWPKEEESSPQESLWAEEMASLVLTTIRSSPQLCQLPWVLYGSLIWGQNIKAIVLHLWNVEDNKMFKMWLMRFRIHSASITAISIIAR